MKKENKIQELRTRDEALHEIKARPELPKEHSRITEKGSLMIMDILVEFKNGEMGNVEIQK